MHAPSVNHSYDLIVIGGGFAGAALTYHAARAGARVLESIWRRNLRRLKTLVESHHRVEQVA